MATALGGSEFFDKLRETLRGELRRHEPMARHTTWRVGGPAELFLIPADRADLLTALKLLAVVGMPWLVIGSGSNLLVRDGGIHGAVIDTAGLKRLEFLPGGAVAAEAGVPLGALIEAAVERGLAGLEALYGIPGTVGGALAMNAGVPGCEFGTVVETVWVVEGAALNLWDHRRLAFGYRSSGLSPADVAVEARLQLAPGDPGALGQVLEERLAARRSSQNVGFANAGSVFRNPPGRKAWELIAATGLQGVSIGGARVSEVHANFIVNQGRAKAADILALMAWVQRAVEQQSGIWLEPEVRIVGLEESAGQAAQRNEDEA